MGSSALVGRSSRVGAGGKVAYPEFALEVIFKVLREKSGGVAGSVLPSYTFAI